jgi:hypothetical protein
MAIKNRMPALVSAHLNFERLNLDIFPSPLKGYKNYDPVRLPGIVSTSAKMVPMG